LNSKAKYFIAGAMSSIIWGFFSISLRAIKDHPSMQILVFRILCSLIITIIISLVIRKKVFKKDVEYLESLDKKERNKLLLRIFYSSLIVTANWFSFIYVINHVSVQAGAFAYMVCPIITAVFAFIFLKEKLSTIKWVSIALCFLSIAFLSLGFVTEVIYSVIIAVLYAAYLMLQKRIEGLDKLNVLMLQLLISSVFVIPIAGIEHVTFTSDVNFWMQIVIISIFFTIIPLFLSLYALIGMPSSTMGILIYINPIVAFIVAFFYFDESSTVQKMIAYFILLISVILFNYSFIRGMFSIQIREK
jgi:chloramphenicol-sensitive protein RarD